MVTQLFFPNPALLLIRFPGSACDDRLKNQCSLSLWDFYGAKKDHVGDKKGYDIFMWEMEYMVYGDLRRSYSLEKLI
jgi:hypothetical protein